MKKILYAITKSSWGGAGRYVYELAVKAKEAGYDVEVAFGGRGALDSKLQAVGIPTHSIDSSARDMNLLKEFKTLIAFYKIVRKVKPDIVHLNSPKMGGLGSVVARLAGVKEIIYTNHGWSFNEDRPMWQLILIRFFSWLIILFNKKIIFLTETEYNMVRHWPLVASRRKKNSFVIIPIAIKPFKLYEKEESLINLLGEQKAIELIKSNKRIVGNISELHKNKGYPFALRGLKLYKETVGPAFNIHFIIVSSGEEKENLENLIKELGLEDDVTMTGFISEAREFVRAFDLFLLSSIKEGLPYCILEAGYAGVPVISTNVGGIAEVIKNLETGFLIESGNPEAIKNTLMHIYERPGEERQYADALKKLVDDHYNFASLIEKTFALYK